LYISCHAVNANRFEESYELFISDAFAAGVPSGAQADGSFSLIMIVAIFVLSYFMLIRPQNKRAKEQRELINH